ncbi:glycosyltransferase involved in cell wall biosynthesis [Streptomyces sp. V4I23]|uniref:glycosyltransferase family 4 protein n=1 Tax=Streptomyces sp. V4I23 TaxID=3042282 RepID=UPI002780DC10|nr:glycosyltransferase family 4 protein [Streptomyces sp. V4I23]MDQ1006970.1 glycosyltransferase involved in cell wall biosynthesis [Streptomyces sp. V4I23]
MLPIRRRNHPNVSLPTLLVLRHSSELGGMGRAAEFFTPVLRSRCQVVAVLSLSADRSGNCFEASWLAKASATVMSLGRCVYVLVTRSPDAIYLPISQWGLPLFRDLILVMLARMLGCAPVLHLHGAQLPFRLTANRMLRRMLGRSHWIVLSEAVAAELEASGCHTRSVTVVRNPIPQSVVSRRTPSPTQVLRVGWLGTMCRAKGFDVLCDAVDQLKSSGVGLEFSVAGLRLDVPASHMACVDEDLGVLPPANVSSFWSRIDVFVLPARWVEGLPFVLLEGLQAGCVVAATHSPGCAELFDQGCVEPVDSSVGSVTGFLKECVADLEGIRRRQQKLWAELRPLYEADRVKESFARFLQDVWVSDTRP